MRISLNTFHPHAWEEIDGAYRTKSLSVTHRSSLGLTRRLSVHLGPPGFDLVGNLIVHIPGHFR